MNTVDLSEVSHRYAVTLLEAAERLDALQATEREAEGILAALSASPELNRFLCDPLTDVESKRSTLKVLLEGKVSALMLDFLRLMAGRRRGRAVRTALGSFIELAEERRGRVRADVHCAAPLTPEQLDRLRRRLAAYTGKDVCLHIQVDPELRAGLVVRVGDMVFDGTLVAQLERLRTRLLRTQVNGTPVNTPT